MEKEKEKKEIKERHHHQNNNNSNDSEVSLVLFFLRHWKSHFSVKNAGIYLIGNRRYGCDYLSSAP